MGNLRGNRPGVGVAEKVDIVTFVSGKIDKHVAIAIGAIEDVENLAELTEAHFLFRERLTGLRGQPQIPIAFTIDTQP
jgi:hypothetical protein